MWDDNSFESRSFEPGSWLFNFVQVAARFVARMKSTIAKAIHMNSGI